MAEHFCKEHKQPWFKKGKMPGYAHPILDDDGEPTGKWCNEPEGEHKETKTSGKSLEVTQLELESKARNTALMQSCEMAKAEQKIKTVDEVLAIADRFYAWLKGTAIASKASPSMPAKQQPEASKTEQGSGQFKTAADLFLYACKHGWTMTKIKDKLGTSNPNEVKDLPKAIEILTAESKLEKEVKIIAREAP